MAELAWAAEGLADVFSIELRLTDLGDPDLHARVLGIPTAFRIGEEERGLLRRAARRSLERSAEFQRLLASVASAR